MPKALVAGLNLIVRLGGIPVLSPWHFDCAAAWQRGVTVGDWVLRRVVELACTSADMHPLAAILGMGRVAFKWDASRRELIRAELDAAFFHLYGLAREEADYAMDTFPIVQRKDQQAYGDYRTKRLILERYDALSQAIASGVQYETSLDPPPYEMTAVTVRPPLEHALPTTVAEGSAPGTCVYCVPVVIVR